MKVRQERTAQHLENRAVKKEMVLLNDVITGILQDCPPVKKEEPIGLEEIEHWFDTDSEAPVTQGAVDDLERAWAYSTRHGCTLMDAVAALAQGTPEFAAPMPAGFTVTRKGVDALDRARAHAREHGGTILDACLALSIPIFGAAR